MFIYIYLQVIQEVDGVREFIFIVKQEVNVLFRMRVRGLGLGFEEGNEEIVRLKGQVRETIERRVIYLELKFVVGFL